MSKPADSAKAGLELLKQRKTSPTGAPGQDAVETVREREQSTLAKQEAALEKERKKLEKDQKEAARLRAELEKKEAELAQQQSQQPITKPTRKVTAVLTEEELACVEALAGRLQNEFNRPHSRSEAIRVMINRFESPDTLSAIVARIASTDLRGKVGSLKFRPKKI